MAKKKQPELEEVIPQERNMIKPAVTAGSVQDILVANSPSESAFYRDEGGKARINFASLMGYKPGTAGFGSYGLTTQEAANSEEKAKQLAQQINDTYAILNPRLRSPKNTNATIAQIYNEIAALPDYAAQSLVRTGAGAYNAIAGAERNAAEDAWAYYISQFDENDKDISDLLSAIERQNPEVDPLHYKTENMTKDDGTPLSKRAIDIFEEYRGLLQKRREDALRIKTMEFFEADEVKTVRNAMGSLGHVGGDFGGDNETIVHTIGKLTGDVAGSMVLSYGVGTLYRGAAGALKVLSNISKIKKAAAANAALKTANQLFVSASVVGAEAALATPIGLSQYESIRRQAILAGKDIGEANAVGIVAGIAEAGLEFAGFKVFKRLYRRENIIMQRILGEIVPESLQEGSQQFAENIITNTFGLTEYKFTEIMSQVGLAMLGGALGGAAGGNMMSSTEKLLNKVAGVRSKYDQQLSKFSDETIKQATKEVASDYIKRTPDNTKSAAQEVAEEEKTKSEKSVAQTEQQQEVPLDISEVERKFKEDKEGNFEIFEKEDEPIQTTEQESKAAETVESKNQQQTAQEEQKPVEQVKSKDLSKDISECKNIVKLLYGDVLGMYTEYAKRHNPDITEEQLKSGFAAVAVQVSMYKEGKINELFENIMSNMITYTERQSQMIQDNKIELANYLKQKGYSEELRQQLLSPDWATRHKAQWDIAQQMVKDIFRQNGLSEAEADLAFKQMKGFAYNFTFTNPGITVSDLITALNFNLVNTQLEEFRGKLEIPDNLKSILSYANKNKDIYVVNKLVELFSTKKEIDNERITKNEQDEVDRSISRYEDINEALYGDNVDPTLVRTTASLRFLQGVFENVYNNSSFSANRDLTQQDFFKMAIMHTLGFSKAEIFDEFGITSQNKEDASDVNAAFDKYFNKVYPSTNNSKASVKKMNKLLQSASDKKMAETADGLFLPENNTAIVKNPAYLTAYHETSHFSITNFVTRLDNLVSTGLVDENSPSLRPLKNLREHLTKILSRKGKIVDENTLQETMIDALTRFYADSSIQKDKELAKILEDVHGMHIDSSNNGIYNSMYDSLSIEDTKTSKEKLGELDNTIRDIVENNTPAAVLEKIDRLQKILSFQEPIIAGELKSVNQAEQYFDNMYNEISNILNSTFVPNGDMFASALENAKNNKDLFSMMSIGNDIAISARNFCFECLTKSSKSNKELSRNTDAFYNIQVSAGGSLLIKQPRTSIAQDAVLGVEKLKEMSGQEIWQASREYVGKHIDSLAKTYRDFTESLSHAAYGVNNELGALIERSMYDYGMDTVADKKLVAKFDNLTYDAFIKNPALYTRFRQIISNPEMFVDKEGKSLVKQIAVDLLTKNISKEAGDTCAEVFDRIDDVRRSLQVYGLSSDMFKKEGYFPLRVSDYKGLLSHFGTAQQSQTIKEAKRLYNELVEKTKNKNEGKELTKEQSEQIYLKIVDFVNGSLRSSSAGDEYGVTSFFRRQLEIRNSETLQYYEDPMDSLASFFESARRTIMMRKLAGFAKSDTAIDFETGEKVKLSPNEGLAGRIVFNVGTFFNDEDTQAAIQNFNEKFRYFTTRVKTDPNSFFGLLRQMNNLTTLGSVVNTVNQAMDVIPMLQMFGFKNVIQGMKDIIKGSGVKLQDVGVESSNELFRPVKEGKLSKIQKLVFKFTGFEKFDTFIKESGLNAAKVYFSDALSQKGTEKYNEAMKYIDEVFPETDFVNNSIELSEDKISAKQAVIEDLKKGTMSYDARAVLQHMLAKTQPINSVVAAAKLGAVGNFGKLCYQFTGPALRQLEWLSDRVVDKYKSGGFASVGIDMARLLMFLFAIGLPKEIITNMIRNRETNIPTTMALLPGHFFMINEYTLSVAKREGLWAGFSTMTAPSGSWINNVSKDFVRFASGKDYRGYTFKNIPVFGDAAFYWMFGGYEFNKRTGIALVTNPLDEVQEDYDNAVDKLRRIGS